MSELRDSLPDFTMCFVSFYLLAFLHGITIAQESNTTSPMGAVTTESSEAATLSLVASHSFATSDDSLNSMETRNTTVASTTTTMASSIGTLDSAVISKGLLNATRNYSSDAESSRWDVTDSATMTTVSRNDLESNSSSTPERQGVTSAVTTIVSSSVPTDFAITRNSGDGNTRNSSETAGLGGGSGQTIGELSTTVGSGLSSKTAEAQTSPMSDNSSHSMPVESSGTPPLLSSRTFSSTGNPSSSTGDPSSRPTSSQSTRESSLRSSQSISGPSSASTRDIHELTSSQSPRPTSAALNESIASQSYEPTSAPTHEPTSGPSHTPIPFQSSGSTLDLSSNRSTLDQSSNGSTPDQSSNRPTLDRSSDRPTLDQSSNGLTPGRSSWLTPDQSPHEPTSGEFSPPSGQSSRSNHGESPLHGISKSTPRESSKSQSTRGSNTWVSELSDIGTTISLEEESFLEKLSGRTTSKEYSLVVYQEDLASSEINENVVTVVFDRYISSAYWMVKFDRLFRDTAVRYLAVYMELMSRSKNETEEEWSWGLNSSDVLYVDPTPRGEDEAFFVSLVVKDKSKNKEMAERNESSKVSPWVDGQVLLHALQDQIFALSLKLEMNISRISQGLPTEMEKGKGREGFFVRNQELVIGIFIAVIVILMLIFSLGCYCHQRSQANYPHHFTPRNTYFAGGGEEFMDLGQHLATDEECKHSEGMATFLHGQGHGEQQRGKANGKAKAPKNNMNGRQMRSFNPLQGGGRVNLNEPDTTEECDWATPAPANLNTLVQEEDMTRI